MPAVSISEAALTTPDVRLGGAVVEVPDLVSPELAVPAVPVLETVTGLLG